MIEKAELDNRFLKLQLTNEVTEESNPIVLRNRSTKEEIIISPLIENNNQVLIDLSSIHLHDNDFIRYDVFFLQDDRKIRARMESVYQKKKIDRFFSNIYNYTNSYVIVPYVTTNNNLSLLLGNAGNVFETYCQYVPVRTPILASANATVSSLQLELNSISMNREAVFIAYYDKKTEKYIALDYKLSDNHPNEMNIYPRSVSTSVLYNNLYVMWKKRNIIEYAEMSMENDALTNKKTDKSLINQESKPLIHSNIVANNIENKKNKLWLKISTNDFNSSYYNSVRVFLKDKSKKIYFLNDEDISLNETNLFALDLSGFLKKHTLKKGRWSVHLLTETDTFREEMRVGQFNMPVLLKHERYFEPVAFNTYHLVTPYLTANNAFSLVVKPKVALHEEMLPASTELRDFKRKNNRMYTGEVFLQVEETDEYTVESVILKYRNKMDDREYSFPVHEDKQDNNTSQVTFDINVNKIKLEQFYWDVFLQIRIQHQLFLVKVKNYSEELNESIFFNEHKYTIKYKNGFVLHPYIANNNSLVLFYKENSLYEGFWMRMKSEIAYKTSQRFKKQFDKKEIWLIHEKFSRTAQDNSYFFFKYMYENHPEENFYYVIDQKSPDYQNVKNMKDRVISFMSFKHLLYLYASKLFISSDAKNHSYIFRQKNGRAIEEVRNKSFVYLKHGVTALKNVGYIMKKSGSNGADLFVTIADWEADIIHHHFGYAYEDIITTGLCRWDALIDKSKENNPREIMLMPTWRNWLEDVSEELFIQSDYYRQYMELLQSTKLQQLLAEHNLILNFNIHPKFLPYIKNFQMDTERIKVFQYGEAKINELLMRSSLLITDYSSVAWDFYYLKKPVVFFQFDHDTYEELQGSYVDMKTDLFGDRFLDVDSLIEGISDYIANDFTLKDRYEQIWKNSFKSADKNNSKRTYNAIKENAYKLGLTKDNEEDA